MFIMIILDLLGAVIKFQLKIPPYELNLKYLVTYSWISERVCFIFSGSRIIYRKQTQCNANMLIQ
jgi:hypothetical protein